VLSDYLRSKAEWRRRQEKQFPNDMRNEKSADALDSLADWTEGPEVSQTALERLAPHQHDADTLGGERTWRAVSRYGYQNIVVTDHHPAFLDELAALCQLDAYNHAAEQGDDPTGTLEDFEMEAAAEGLTLPRRYFELRLDLSEDEMREAVADHRVRAAERAEAEAEARKAEAEAQKAEAEAQASPDQDPPPESPAGAAGD